MTGQDAAKRAEPEEVWTLTKTQLDAIKDAAVAEAVAEKDRLIACQKDGLLTRAKGRDDTWAHEFIAKIADAAYPKGYSGGHTHDEILGRVEKLAKWLEEWQEEGARMPGKLAEARREERERAATMIEASISEYCQRDCVTALGAKKFCEDYSCHHLRDLADAIRVGPPTRAPESQTP